MANEKKNTTLEDLIMEMLKEGKAVRIPVKDVVEKLQENAKADTQADTQQGAEKSEAVPQDEQVKTVPINIHIDSLHIHMDERMTSYNNFDSDSDEVDEPEEDEPEPEDIDVDAMIGLIKAKTGLCEKVILAVLAAQEEYLDSIWGEDAEEDEA